MFQDLCKRIITDVLQLEARLVVRKYAPRIVAVAGSVGKTATKDAVYTALSSAFYVRKSEKSYNTELGVPLTILGCENAWHNPFKWLGNIWEGVVLLLTKNHYPKWLVLEVGVDRPGDMQRTASWLRPDVAILTRLPDVPVHVEYFSSPEAVAREKWSLTEHLADEGIIVLNYDDERLLRRKAYARHLTITYGFAEGADVRATNAAILYEHGRPSGMTFRVDVKDTSVPVSITGVVGIQHIYPILAALATAMCHDVTLVAAGQAFRDAYTPPAGRMRLIDGVSDATLIDDSYNASPAAMTAALDALAEIETDGRKIAVLGDMLELGTYTAAAHRDVGTYAYGRADIVVAVGVRARHIAEEAHAAGVPAECVYTFGDATEAAVEVSSMLGAGDAALIKGSESMRMETIVKACMARPDDAAQLLVRQEPEWRAK